MKIKMTVDKVEKEIRKYARVIGYVFRRIPKEQVQSRDNNRFYYAMYNGNCRVSKELTLTEWREHWLNNTMTNTSFINNYNSLNKGEHMNEQTKIDLSKIEVKTVDSEYFNEYLGVLPPANWTVLDGVESFYCPEHISGNLVRWCAYNNNTDKYYTFIAPYNIDKKYFRHIIEG